jgi:hypothetical protein
VRLERGEEEVAAVTGRRAAAAAATRILFPVWFGLGYQPPTLLSLFSMDFFRKML